MVIFLRRQYNDRMSESRKHLYEKAMKLPQGERAALIGDLIESLDQSVDQEAQVMWDAEIARRVIELEDGKSQTVSWEEVRRKLRGIVGDQAA